MIKKSRSRFRGGKVKSLLRFLFVYLEDLSTRVLSFSRSGRCLKTRVRWCIKMFRLSIIFKQYDFTRYNLKCDQHLLVKRKIRRIAVKFLSWCDFAWNFKTFKDLLCGQLISSWRSTWRRWKIFLLLFFLRLLWIFQQPRTAETSHESRAAQLSGQISGFPHF